MLISVPAPWHEFPGGTIHLREPLDRIRQSIDRIRKPLQSGFPLDFE